MSEKKRFLRLDSIVAYLQTEVDGDEIFIKYNDEVVAPVESKYIRMTKEPAPLNVEVELDESAKWVELELWDYDHFSPNDCLGRFKLFVDEAGEGFSAELAKDKQAEARYVLNWSVVERRNKSSR
jgi:hypothetical protein